jgi:Ca-activated chloride channel family protein
MSGEGQKAPRWNRRLVGAWGCLLALAAIAAPSSFLIAQSGRKQANPSSKSPPARVRRPSDAGPASQNDAARPSAGKPPAELPESGATPVEIDEGEVVRIASNLVPIPTSVVDAQGRPVTNLALKDFELHVDGEPRPLGDLSRAETPVIMAVLFDNSSSLRAGREFEKQSAIKFFKNVLRPVDRAALFSVSTDGALEAPLTNDVKALVRAVENFGKPEGATSLFDVIDQAADYLRPHRGRKVIVLVSDGVDTSSRLDFDTTLRRALAADCQIYAVQTGHSDNTNLRDLVAERRLQELTAQTGGAVYAPRSNPELDKAFASISADLAQQYVLSYYPTGALRAGSFHAFTLRVPARHGLRVRTRKGYYTPKG